MNPLIVERVRRRPSIVVAKAIASSVLLSILQFFKGGEQKVQKRAVLYWFERQSNMLFKTRKLCRRHQSHSRVTSGSVCIPSLSDPNQPS